MEKGKALKLIQGFANICKIASTVAKIVFTVGGIMSVVGIVTLIAIPYGIKVGGITLKSLIEINAGTTIATAVIAAAIGGAFCTAGRILATRSEAYFTHELEAGTPFTSEGSLELRKLGIATAITSIVTSVVCGIGYEIANYFFEISKDVDYIFDCFGLGLTFIAVSIIFQYGADVLEESKITPITENTENTVNTETEAE